MTITIKINNIQKLQSLLRTKLLPCRITHGETSGASVSNSPSRSSFKVRPGLPTSAIGLAIPISRATTELELCLRQLGYPPPSSNQDGWWKDSVMFLLFRLAWFWRSSQCSKPIRSFHVKISKPNCMIMCHCDSAIHYSHKIHFQPSWASH